MPRSRSRRQSRLRLQRAVAIILLLCLILSGLAFYAAANSLQKTPQTTQSTPQGR